MAKLSKLARRELEYRHGELERVLNDVWRDFYNALLKRHGQCENGINCPRNPGLIHLRHGAVETDMLESEFLTAIRGWLDHGIIVVRKHNPEATL